ncbi:hypothetical protein, partial [Aeromonas hydrophila]|uniref:hypothetical protein n=1 Tax=Aeromonas hydrophila TaxID=644 RepID=UPI001C87372A
PVGVAILKAHGDTRHFARSFPLLRGGGCTRFVCLICSWIIICDIYSEMVRIAAMKKYHY